MIKDIRPNRGLGANLFVGITYKNKNGRGRLGGSADRCGHPGSVRRGASHGDHAALYIEGEICL